MKILITNLLLICSLLVSIGCAHIQQGQDPLIVRTEQAETIASKAFDSVIELDHSDRGYWRTNAPAFHQFCEYLRTPVTIADGTFPRGLAMIKAVDDAKLAYKQAHSQSNALLIAVLTLESTVSQAQSWSTIINQPTH